MQQVEDRIIEKLQALLRLARDAGATEAEASLALERAHALLLKHGLEMADVEEDGSEPSAVFEDAWDGLLGQTWIASLVNVVGRHHYCRVLRSNSTGKLIVVGRKVNVRFTYELSMWLVRQVSNLASADWAAREWTGETKGLREREWRQSFIYGVLNRLDERLGEQRADEEGQRSDARALVVHYEAENKDFMAQHYPNLGHARSVPLHVEAYRSGVNAGDGVSVNPASRQVRSGQ